MGPRPLLARLSALAALLGRNCGPTLCAATSSAASPPRGLEELQAPKMELETFLDVLSGVLGGAAVLVTILVSVNQMWTIHLARARTRADRLDADAAAAVAAINAEYVAPLRRVKMARLFEAPPLQRATASDETQHLARLYISWALALNLTPEEGATAFERAVEFLAEDYPDRGEGELQGKINKALQLAKEGMPGTLENISTFISRCRQCPPSPL